MVRTQLEQERCHARCEVLHPVPRRVLGVSADDALPDNYGEVFSQEGLHAGVLRVVERRLSLVILPVDGQLGPAVQKEPRELLTRVTQRLYLFLLASKSQRGVTEARR